MPVWEDFKLDTVVEIISVISGKERDRLVPDANLRSLGITSSIEILKIQSALERKFNQKLPPIGDTWTIGKIAVEVGQYKSDGAEGTASTGSEIRVNKDNFFSSPNGKFSTFNVGGLFIGVDIEEVDHLPLTSNYRTHDFYRSLFNNEEISYALLKSEPRQHLCGIFCAKEALKKSAPELIQLRMDEILVSHYHGRPFISIINHSFDSIFNFQVSISHSTHYAMASVLAIAH
jgi:holo-[acyl-carrier protein] synthase